MTQPVSPGELPLGAWLAGAGVEVPAASEPWAGPDPDASSFFDLPEDEDDDERPARPWRSRALWAGAVALWALLVLGAGAVWLGSGQEERTQDEAGAHDAAGALPGDAEGDSAGPGELAARPTERSATDRAAEAGANEISATDARAIEARASVALHLAVTRHADALGPARYVDHVTVERITVEHELAVVTLLAVVLEGTEGRWESTSVRRFGLALRMSHALELIGAPWPLPGGDLGVEVPAEPSDLAGRDETRRYPAAMTALEAAGYTEVVLLHVAVVPERPALMWARLEGIAPGETAPAEHEVWLRDDVPPHVLGALPSTDPDRFPSAHEQEQP